MIGSCIFLSFEKQADAYLQGEVLAVLFQAHHIKGFHSHIPASPPPSTKKPTQRQNEGLPVGIVTGQVETISVL